MFIGGGLSDPALLPSVWRALRPGGRLVANVVSTEGERALLDWQAQHGGALTRLAVSRAEPLGLHLGWRALAPVTQLFTPHWIVRYLVENSLGRRRGRWLVGRGLHVADRFCILQRHTEQPFRRRNSLFSASTR